MLKLAKEYLLILLSTILIVFLTVLTCGCEAKPTQIGEVDTTSMVIPTQDFVLSPMVRGCAETMQGMASRAAGGEEEQDPSIEVTGNTVRYARAMKHQCCRKVEFKHEVKGSVITLFEVWSGEGCRCMCFSEVGAALENVPSGNYTVRVYESGTLAGSSDPMKQSLLISKEVNIP